MSPHSPPIYNITTVTSPAVTSWLREVTSAREFLHLAESLSALPLSWIRWAAKIADRRAAQGVTIRHHLNYRLSILWNGVIALQESKFICDQVEIALRQAIGNYTFSKNICLVELHTRIPEWHRIVKRLSGEDPSSVLLDRPISETALSNLNFYQTTELVARHWHLIGRTVGFKELFWKKRCCRDVGIFLVDLGRIREARNKIAHAKSLFEPHEVIKLYELSKKWIDPIDTQFDSRLSSVRRRRPGFLSVIEEALATRGYAASS